MLLHSIKSIIRTPKKTILFLFLISLLTMFLSIGAGMYISAHNMLADADKTFNTVVELNYLGDRDNDDKAFYEQMNTDIADFNFQKLMNNSHVHSMNMEGSALAYIDDKQINQSLSEINNYVIIEVISIRPYDDGLYQGIINKVHFGRTMRENTHVLLSDLNEFGEEIGYNFIYGHTYLIIGRKADGKNPTPIITPGLPEEIEGFSYVLDLEEYSDFFISDDGNEMLKLVEAFHVVDSSLPVTMVSSLEASEVYFNQEMIIDKGRVFLPDEYQEGNNDVILISKTLAEFYELKPGDRLKLNLHYAKKGIGLSDYFIDYSFSNVDTYEVVGIFENKMDSRYKIYMPMADWLKQDFNSISLARYHVKNGKGYKFMKAFKKELLPQMEFTLYDQGYEAATKPIVELKDTSILILIFGGFSGITILLLFTYLYVIKQKETLINMLSLGAGKKRTLIYILFGSLLLLLTASSIGAFTTNGFLRKLTQKIFDRMASLYKTDLRYSERAIGLQMDFTAKVSISNWIPVIIILLILLIALIMLYGFTIYVFNIDKSNVHKARKLNKAKAQKFHISKLNKEHDAMFGQIRPIPLKFALVSLTRNTGRSFIVPLLALILSVFLVFLGFLSNIQINKRDNVYDNIPVNAYITTYKNETRDLGGLSLQYDIYRLIDPTYSYRMEWDMDMYEAFKTEGEYTSLRAEEERLKLLMSSEYFKDMYLYSAVHYEYMGISKTKDGDENLDIASIPIIRKHKDAFGFDWFLNAISKMPKLAYADDIRYTPDFFNSQSYEVEFLSGYGYDSLRQRENIGIIPSKFASKNEIDLGDTVRITAWADYGGEYAVCSVIDFLVIGIYNQTWQTDIIYMPWIMSYDHNYFVDFEFPVDPDEEVDYFWDTVWNEILPRTVRAATFTLKNTDNLNSFREYLDEQGYSEAGKIKANRRAIVIQDKKLEETIKTLDNYIKLMEILIPIMLILFGIIGFMVSYLLIRHRLNELAIMRSMGAGKVHVFLSFFIEQLILFFIGLIPVLIFGVIFQEYFIYYKASLGYFIISYLAGTGLALLYLGKADLLDILFTKE